MQLFNVTFTTQKLVAQYDEKGKMVCQKMMGTPITMTMLPYKTAMQYKGCDNFEITPYEFQNKGTQVSRKRDGIGNGTRSVGKRNVTSSDFEQGHSTVKAKTPGKSSVQRAAETGNLSEAIND